MNQDGSIVNFTEDGKKKFTNQIKDYARRGLRTLAICYKE